YLDARRREMALSIHLSGQIRSCAIGGHQQPIFCPNQVVEGVDDNFSPKYTFFGNQAVDYTKADRLW
ncbi:MAG: hypothetical protein KDI62_27660, partial [Anaerolineae bacterium]|nr:hypothetical protein [Anaerolineae bacterium]